jgi:hypothetical protein
LHGGAALGVTGMGVAVRVDARLDVAVRALQRRGVEGECRRQPEEREMVFQTLKDSPQPHSSLTFGLRNLNPSFRPSRV